MMLSIDRQPFKVNIDEFNVIPHPIYNNLKIHSSLDKMERLVGFIRDIQQSLNIKSCIIIEPTHGGFIPIKCTPYFEQITILDCSPTHRENIQHNIKEQQIKNILWDIFDTSNDFIMYSEHYENIDYKLIQQYNPILITSFNPRIVRNNLYNHTLKFSDKLHVYIPDKLYNLFFDNFKYYIFDNADKADKADNPGKYIDKLKKLVFKIKNQTLETDNRIRFGWNY